MNQQRYRIVFNRLRGALMVVGETARLCGKAAGRGAGAGGPAPVWAGVRPLVFSVWTALGLVAFAPAGAQVVADPSAAGTERPTVLNAPNGVPLVNIQTPSAAGVSRNVYSQFDVQQQGAILNNSRTAVATEQGGWVQGNPWLAKGSARVILNEVNSSQASQLRGYVEVAGQRAQVIIANPAGISCNGCGFINANRATLTTGQPIMNNGALEGYRVQRGRIEVSGAGLDASGADYADL
ncbi:MAG TPA: filamentous hemagglutinin N-terminal domain-containing protein, partial [Burkholderiaceae bacterium]|nr:filamentous hemagglutinin N-terminal domain-containing protein [Burkholderiaceae bacterium]